MDWNDVVFYLGASHQIHSAEKLWETPTEMALCGVSATLGSAVRVNLQLVTSSAEMQCQAIQTAWSHGGPRLLPLLGWSVMRQRHTDNAFFCWVWPETTYTLADVIERSRMEMTWSVLPEDQLTLYLSELVQCLADLHNAGLVHGSIDPNHFSFLPNGQMRLSLWCESRELQSQRWQCISPFYTSPIVKSALRSQQLSVQHDAMKTDVYALGLTILTLIKKEIPQDLMEIDTLEDATRLLIDSLPYDYKTKTMLIGMLRREEDLRFSTQKAIDCLFSRVTIPSELRFPEVISFIKVAYSATAHSEEVKALTNAAINYTKTVEAQNAESILTPAVSRVDWSMEARTWMGPQMNQYERFRSESVFEEVYRPPIPSSPAVLEESKSPASASPALHRQPQISDKRRRSTTPSIAKPGSAAGKPLKPIVELGQIESAKVKKSAPIAKKSAAPKKSAPIIKQSAAPVEEKKSAPIAKQSAAPVEEEKKVVSPGGESIPSDMDKPLRCIRSSCSGVVNVKVKDQYFPLLCDAEHFFCSITCCKNYANSRSDKSQAAKCPICNTDFAPEVMKEIEGSWCTVF